MHFAHLPILCCAVLAVAKNPKVTLRDQGKGVVQMPRVALGTGGFDNATAQDAVTKAFSVGFTHIHAAYDYYNLPGVGAGLTSNTAPPRREIFVTAMTSPCIHVASKPFRNVTDAQQCEELTTREINETLHLLQQPYADLLLLHGPSEPFGYEGGCDAKVNALNAAQWRAYTAALFDGRARAIGVSNYCPSCLESLKPAPAVNQIQWHVGMGNDPEGLMSYCQRHQIVVQAYSPLASGAVVSDCSLCDEIGQKHYNKSGAEVAVQWVLQKQHGGSTVVVKADSKIFDSQNLGVFDWGPLKQEDEDALDKLTEPRGQQNGRPSWGCAK